MKKQIIDTSISLVEEISLIKREFDKINDNLRSADSNNDFATRLSPIALGIEVKLIKLLDEIFAEIGDSQLASYFLYEAQNMKGGGEIVVDGVNFRLQSIADLKKYVKYLMSAK